MALQIHALNTALSINDDILIWRWQIWQSSSSPDSPRSALLQPLSPHYTRPATDCWARVIPPPHCSSCRAWGRTPSVSPRCLATANFGLLKKGAFCNLSEMETLCHYISCAGGSCCGAGYRCTALSPVQLLLHSSVVLGLTSWFDTRHRADGKFEESLNSAFFGSHSVTFLGNCAMFPSQNSINAMEWRFTFNTNTPPKYIPKNFLWSSGKTILSHLRVGKGYHRVTVGKL